MDPVKPRDKTASVVFISPGEERFSSLTEPGYPKNTEERPKENSVLTKSQYTKTSLLDCDFSVLFYLEVLVHISSDVDHHSIPTNKALKFLYPRLLDPLHPSLPTPTPSSLSATLKLSHISRGFFCLFACFGLTCFFILFLCLFHL